MVKKVPIKRISTLDSYEISVLQWYVLNSMWRDV